MIVASYVINATYHCALHTARVLDKIEDKMFCRRPSRTKCFARVETGQNGTKMVEIFERFFSEKFIKFYLNSFGFKTVKLNVFLILKFLIFVMMRALGDICTCNNQVKHKAS